MDLLHRYQPEQVEGCFEIAFENANSILKEERNKAFDYLRDSLRNCDG